MKEKARGTISHMGKEPYKKQLISFYATLVASILFLVAGVLFFCIRSSTYSWLYLTCGIVLCVASAIWLVLAIYNYSKLQETKRTTLDNKGDEK